MSQLLRQADDKFDQTNEQQTRSSINARIGNTESNLQRKTTTRGGQSNGQGQITCTNGGNNDVSLDYATYVRIMGPTSSFSLTGVKNGEKGAFIVLYNATAQTMTLANESASSSANNRIHTPSGADMALQGAGGSVAFLQYDITLKRWIVVSYQVLTLPITGITGLGTNVLAFLQATLPSTVATFLGTPSSANLAAALTDETGAGAAVFANAPTIINPIVGTQSVNDNSTKAASTAYVDGALSSLDLVFTELALQVADNTNVALFLGDAGNRVFDSFDALTYVNTGGATNLDTSTAGILKPTQSSTNQDIGVGAGDTSGAVTSGVTYIDINTALTAADVISAIKVRSSSAQSMTLKIAKRNSSGNFDIVASQTVAHPGGGQVTFALVTPFTVPGTGSYYVGAYLASSGSGCATTSNISQASKSGDITGTGQSGFSEVTNNGVALSVLKNPSTNNLTVTSTAFTAASAPTTMKGLIRVKEVNAATAGTDYTLEFSRDGGTTWTTATLTELFTSPSPDASIVVVSSNVVTVSGQPAGTSPMWRFKTLNNKNVQLYDAALYWA